ncbi:cupin domain-containing protein [Bordetella trematum]|uniref:cupin domain-containing protein n=1 Tax=Bordetella trematum TaxID=123899 RepID=UPI000D879C36|nr:cupin domain-containing protein [Bordetella trematum]SPU51110.1 Cupin domain [Bordetella trematum]VDH07369.1 Cupin domain [Bordetella trematum]
MPSTALAVHPAVNHFFLLADDGRVRALGGRRAGFEGWVTGLKEAPDSAAVHGDVWERHTGGDELLTLLQGEIVLHWMDEAGAAGRQCLRAGESVIVPRGRWHRLEVTCPSQLFFATPSQGSELRRVEP